MIVDDVAGNIWQTLPNIRSLSRAHVSPYTLNGCQLACHASRSMWQILSQVIETSKY
jgi:hypothetical protein